MYPSQELSHIVRKLVVDLLLYQLNHNRRLHLVDLAPHAGCDACHMLCVPHMLDGRLQTCLAEDAVVMLMMVVTTVMVEMVLLLLMMVGRTSSGSYCRANVARCFLWHHPVMKLTIGGLTSLVLLSTTSRE